MAGLALYGTLAAAAPPAAVPQKWHTPYGFYLTPHEAYAMVRDDPAGVLMIDVRTRAEVKYIGMAEPVDAHVPIRFLDPAYRWSAKSGTYRTVKNRNFAADVDRVLASQGLTRAAPIVLTCQSGSRSPIAARVLHAAGFQTVYTQYQGFEGRKAKTGPQAGQRVVDGWKNAGLPWSYTLPEAKMYFRFSGEP